jgi:acyl-coenzyme A synthetase/AMP-(fatty) acid ligase/acyl carrier protein
MAETPGLTADDHLLALTTICFDIAALEIFLPLVVGATVEIVPAAVCRDGLRLRAHLGASAATVVQATPSTWQMLVDAGWSERRLRKILCGGEPLVAGLAGKLLKRCGQLWNMFGPTETTIWSTCARVTDPGDIRLGEPIANTSLYVLDQHGNPVPAGVQAELYIGGAGVADGYVGRPDLTADRFLVDPFAAEPGATMYRTGDAVVRRTDGALIYRHRLDDQTKIRGHRVELEDIRAALAGDPQVAQACAVLDGDGAERQVLAYVVLTGDAGPAAVATIRERLKRVLPAYMLPRAIMVLPRMPLMANGKLNRHALPRPQRAETIALPQGACSPADLAAAHWAHTLGQERADPHTTFFDAGGDSLALTRMVSALSEALGRRITSTDVFEHPTLERFAAFVAAGRKQECTSPVEPKLDAQAQAETRARVRGASYRQNRLQQRSRSLVP